MKIFIPLNQIFGFTSNRFYFLLSLFLLSCTNYSFSQLAFPTAEGFGKNATGGRGGQVIIVTNLNDSGSGSLRAALDATVPRTIVFEVGGTINLNSNIYVSNGDLTLAGQTAPGDGILIKGGMVQFEESNVIVRYIKFRPGPTAPSGYDAVSITAWAGNTVEDIIFDHCSFSWGGDENFNIRGVNGGVVKNITLQNSIVSESTYGFLAGNGCFNISVYKNLFALNSERNIRSNYPVSNELDFEMINNVVYGFRVATKPSLGVQFSVLNNHYKLSSQINPINNAVVDASSSGGGNTSQTHAYISGNIKPISMTVNDSALNPYLETTAYESSGIIPIPASELVNELINNVGASLPTRDAVDIRIIDHFNNGDGTISSSGEYPTILNGTALADTDNDGMPNVWEIENGLNINDASDRNDIQEDGYTNLEYYINFMSLILETNHIDVGSDVSICEGDTTTLTATGADSYVWMPGNFIGESIDVSPSNDITYTVTGTFSDGSSLTETISVIVNPNIIANAGDDTEICQGSTVILAAEGGSSYQWNTGETTQSIEVSPDSTTTYSVEVFNNGCSDTDEVVVFVNDVPTANAGDDVVLNEGESTLLTATGGDSYLWSTGATTSSITVSPDSDTTYTVTVTLNGCESTDQVTVFINASVNADAGEDVIICLGSSTILTATGGSSYQWNTGETTQSIEVSPEMTTTYSVEVFNAAENNSDIDEVEVVVNDIPTANAGDDAEICQGSTVTLAAEGGSSYQWNTGETTQSIEVSPDTTTTYSVEVFNNGCSDTDEIEVVVNETPTPNAGSDLTITEGETVVITATGGESYIWNTGETTPSISVSPLTTTEYSVEVIINNCGATDVVIVFVDELSINADAGDDVTICQGDTATLSASGGDSYLWSTGETTQTIEVSPNQTTAYTVIAYSGSISNSDEVIVDVGINPEITLTADSSVLAGNYITLSASGANNYEWSNGATQPNIAVSPNTTTTYVVTGYINNCYDVKDVTVSVVEQVEVDAGEDLFICQGETITLTANGSGAENYYWNTGETSKSITVSPTENTSYSVVASNSLDSDADDVMVNVQTCQETLEEEEPEKSFNIYYNYRTSSTILNIKLIGWTGQSQMTLHDIAGKLMFTETFDSNAMIPTVKTINTERMSSGVYILSFQDSENILQYKRIVIR
ncbi:MAG: T9SS type A sorting domain-containing protein [Flavobacteriaceae bacterium]|nr:T9SS type A sorting domain-containing protein [Flavobacteriaceae bacterium]